MQKTDRFLSIIRRHLEALGRIMEGRVVTQVTGDTAYCSDLLLYVVWQRKLPQLPQLASQSDPAMKVMLRRAGRLSGDQCFFYDS